MSKRDKGRLPPFVPLLLTTIDCRAWQATSHGAKWLYVTLKRKANSGPRAYISYRDAIKVLKCGRGKVREWFAELEHYGFIRLHTPGCLGVDGKGKAPHWRLTEKGQTSKASPDGLFEPPPNDFLKWDGTLFDPKPYRVTHGATGWDEGKLKKQNPSTHVSATPVPTSGTPPVPTSGTTQEESGTHVGAIKGDITGTHVRYISSVTTTGVKSAAASDAPEPSSDGFSEEEKHVGPSDAKSNVVHIDPRLETLKATEARRRREGAGQ
jgi:hypothetical protein